MSKRSSMKLRTNVLVLLTNRNRYDIMQEYRRKAACILLLYRRVGMKESPCNRESCAEGMCSARAEQVLRDVFGASCVAPEPFERRAMTGFFRCTHF